MNNWIKKLTFGAAILAITGFSVVGCQSGGDKIIIYSNADDEAINVIEQTLNKEGYEGEYEIQTFGTSELGGKLLAEGKDIEADVVTMSSFYLDSAQKKSDMFADLTWDHDTLDEKSSFRAPMTVQEGAIIVNDNMVKEKNLEVPKSIKDLAKPEYKGLVSVVDIDSSSTAWLMVQALISEYGEKEAEEILAGIYRNASSHIESSGSGPLNKVVSGEVPFGFGLRHQVMTKKKEGAPVSLVDPTEGNYALTESVAVVKKDNPEKMEKAQKMAETIIHDGRPQLQEFYPMAIYKGEETRQDGENHHPKSFAQPLTAELLQEHQKLSKAAKEKAKNQ